MATLGENLKAIRKAKKMTQKELAQKSGVKQSVISDLETGNAKSTGSILELANALGVTAEELKKGVVGELITTNVVPVQARMAPVLSWVQAGNFTNVESVDMSQVTEWFPLPDDCEKCFYLKVRGVSNEPDFIEGDYIVVDPTVYYSDMQSGDIIVVRKDKDATFKKLVIESDGTRYLKAINPNFHPNIIPIDEDCYFIGQVIDSLRYTYRGKRRVRKS
ncbi:helix-turn-helix domain-containing protein [Acinetobacter baumannii]|uniref:Helix-turn-helix domain-containing protein n=1 Tax=Acinetobacter baumannii TaxID=470 RepID=A0A090B7T6_ACIBA|nr:S24 family peptidase [Acinetobacter baumannii]EHU2882515.1 helix-turn-helix domain-containing protein [Acinetobacter baumannii]EHU3107665.1 helix-turn-helix domain-containing protein [Acinetobacter baumannii]EHU3331155.1 helix-turn-helix domain-containing protein [Acinetobacter baumannii]EHU3413133.1 helix-turn-helix domain-containing protein [Acinetobacter baumannii]EIB6926101.1 helix-turn-helix domain-containing protein [Acinetobacter baumannii]